MFDILEVILNGRTNIVFFLNFPSSTFHWISLPNQWNIFLFLCWNGGWPNGMFGGGGKGGALKGGRGRKPTFCWLFCCPPIMFDIRAFWFIGQYLIVWELSPFALQIGHVYARRIGQDVRPSLSFKTWLV